jgi:hypothetical protein
MSKTKRPKIIGADDVINQIAETLCQASGEFIETIANQVLTHKVVYQGDSIYTQEE